MKRKLFRLLTALMAVVMFMACSISVMAASGEAVTQDGVTAQLMTDKNSYETGDTINAYVKVDNNTGGQVIVYGQIYAPSGVQLEDANAFSGVLQDGDNWTSSGGVIKGLDNTGTILLYVILAILAVGAAVAAVVFGKKRKGALSVVLCLAMLGGMVATAAPVHAADVSGNMLLDCTVTVDGKEAELTAELSYIIKEQSVTASGESAVEVGKNYLVNGDFEKLEGKSAFESWTAVDSSMTHVGTEAHDGKYSLQVYSKNDTVYQMVEVPAGVSYELTGYVKLVEETGDARFGIVGYSQNEIKDEYKTFSEDAIRFSKHLQNKKLKFEDDILVRGDWMKFTYTVDSTADTQYLYVYFQGQSGISYYDDITLTAKMEESLIVDSSFESADVSADTFTDWQTQLALETPLVGTSAHTGKYALQVENKNEWARQLFPVDPLSKYEISGWFYLQDDTSNARVKYEGYNQNEIHADYNTQSGEINFTNFQTFLGLTVDGGRVEPGQWIHFSWIVDTNQYTKYFAVYFRGNSGLAMFDDVSIKKVQSASRLNVLLNNNHYYLDEETGVATITPNDTAFPDTKSWTANCQVLQGENVIWSKEKIKLSNGEVKVSFPLTDCVGEDFVFRVILCIDGNEVELAEWPFDRFHERPAVLNDEGIFIEKDGDMFHPVFAYHMMSANYDLSVADDCMERLGVNLFQFDKGYVQEVNWEKAIEHLDYLESKGAKAIVCLYVGNNIASRSWDLVSRYIDKISYHDAIYAWGIQDEPVGHATTEEEFRECYELVRAHDPKQRPVYTLDQREHAYPQLIRNADVIAIDNYPYGTHDAMTYVYDSAKYAVETAARSNKPVYTLLQCYERYHGAYMDPALLHDTERYYLPSSNAIRNMIYQSLMAGVKGFGYYGFDYGPGTDADVNFFDTAGNPGTVPNSRTHNEEVQGIKEYAAKEQDLMFEYFVEGKYPTFNSNINGEQYMRYVSFVRGGKVYMVILNKQEFREIKVSVPLTSTRGDVTITGFTAKAYAGVGEEADEASGKLDVKSSGSTLDVTLAPGAAAVYIITPNETIDWSGYPGGNNKADTIPRYTIPKDPVTDATLGAATDEPVDPTNLIKNGGFETTTEDKDAFLFTDWTAEDPKRAIADIIYKKHGKNALKVTNKAARVSQVVDVEPGEIYELSGYIYLDGQKARIFVGGYADDKLENLTDAVKTIEIDITKDNAYMTFSNANGDGQKKAEGKAWNKFSYVFKAGENTEYLQIMMTATSGWTLFDTLSLHKADATTIANSAATATTPLFVEEERYLKGNLVLNSGFELLDEDGDPIKWKIANHTYASIEKDIRKFGDSALKVTNKKANVSQTMGVEPGATYQLHGYVYLEGTSARVQVGGYSNSSATIVTDAVKTIEINTEEDNKFMFFNNDIDGGSYRPAQGTWNWFTYTFTVGDDTDHVKIVLTAQSGITYFDTIALQKVTIIPTMDEPEPEDPTNLIKNGGFETLSENKEDFKFVDWTAEDRENAFLDKDTKRFGYYALAVGNKTARVGQIVDVEPGETYELTGYIWMNGQKARVQVGGYSDAEATNATDAAKTIDISTAADNIYMTFSNETGDGLKKPTGQAWNKFSYTFTAGRNTEYVEIILTGASGITYFDTIALHKAGAGSTPTPPPTATATPAPAPTPDTGLVLNGHFETTGTGEGNDVFAGWNETVGDSNDLAVMGYGDVGKAVQVSGSSYVEQAITVEPGAAYELTGYINMAGLRAYAYVGSTTLHFDLRNGGNFIDGLTFEDANGNPVAGPVQNGGWYKFSYTVTADADTMNLKLIGKAGLTLFDNVTIRKVGAGTDPAPTPTPTPTPTAPSVPMPNTGLVANGHFESVEDGDFANWTETGSVIVVTGYGNVGNAVQVSGSTSVEQTIALESGATYELTGYVNMAGARAYVYAGSTGLHLDLRAGSTLPAGMTFEDANGNPVDRPVQNGGWYKFSYTLTAAADTMNLKLAGKSGLTGFDNISIQKK